MKESKASRYSIVGSERKKKPLDRVQWGQKRVGHTEDK